MIMPPWAKLALVLALTIGGYAAAWKADGRLGRRGRTALTAAGVAGLALWIVFALLVFHPYHRLTLWAIALRSHGWIIVTAALAGAGCAALQARANRRRAPRGTFSRHNGLLLAALIVTPTYLQTVLFPVEPRWADEWAGEVARQSDDSTCGPAATATLLRHFGIRVSEEEAARGLDLSGRGSTAWGVMEGLRRHGLKPRAVWIGKRPESIPTPSIVPVHLGGPGGIGHFVVVFEDGEDEFVFGDPLTGRFRWPKTFAYENYSFTGLAIHVEETGVGTGGA